MLVRFRQTAAGLHVGAALRRRSPFGRRFILGALFRSLAARRFFCFMWVWAYTQRPVSLGGVQLAELADRIDAETQGQIISAVHSRVPIVKAWSKPRLLAAGWPST